MEGAGGTLDNPLGRQGQVGGLLAMQDANGRPSNPNDDLRYVYMYDTSGNVGQLVDLYAANAASAVESLVAENC